jgi:ceramide synthetase
MEVVPSITTSLSRTLLSIRDGPLLNQLMTGLFLFILTSTFVMLAKQREYLAFIEFSVLITGVYFVSKVIFAYMTRFAIYLNEHVFTWGTNKRAFDDERRLRKFCDQGWQLFLHVISSCLQLPCLLQEGLLTDVSRCWDPCPIEQTIPRLMQFAYMFELAAYTYGAMEHRFFSVKRKDYYIMFGHHITTCGLILGSYVTQCYRVGLIVMFIHDSSDIIVDITQLLNHAHMEGGQFFFVAETFFLAMISGWFYTRIYYLPLKVIRSILIEGHKMCALKFPGQPWRYPTCEGIPFWRGGALLLSVLVVMHIYWFYLFLRILWKVLTNSGATDKGKVYETDLDEVEGEKAKQN